MARRCLLVGLMLLAGRSVQAQVPAGFEVVVNTNTAGFSSAATVEMDASGHFVVGWSVFDGVEAPDHGAFIRRYEADGTPAAPQLLLNQFTTGFQGRVSASADARGDFVVLWNEAFDDAKGRRFDASGQPRGGEFLVTDHGQEDRAGVATAANGGFVVSWVERNYPTRLVTGRRYDVNGRSIGSDFQVSAYATSGPRRPSMAGAPDGRFVVTWEAYDGDLTGIHARRFDASGVAQGGEFQVNTDTAYYQTWGYGGQDHTAAMAPDGSFVVVWTSAYENHQLADAMGQRFDAAGNRLGGEFQLNSETVWAASSPRVATDASGNFVVAWAQRLTPETVREIVGRRFDANGVARGPEFHVNTVTTLFVTSPTVDVDPVGNFVVAWDAVSFGYYGSVRFQRFGGLLPAAMTVDTAGNGVLEPGETTDVAPAWRNANGSTQSFTGTLIALTGPTSGTYAITDAAASYGAVANGVSGSCGTNCYGVSVTGTRPGIHWDAVATERLAPSSQGQIEAWPLHLGDSFADVPRTSGFYRFIEALLHRGVTGGCGPTTYCPTAPTTREQLAVFALLAREGPLYAPAPCATPLFADVPASSPYCRWIEELARRGVVGGCGGGNYCPGDAVTREQMAVFMLRTLDPALTPPACVTPLFADVPASSPFCRWIEELARRHVVTGCGGGNYCPTLPVTREQMSVFLDATFGLTLYGP